MMRPRIGRLAGVCIATSLAGCAGNDLSTMAPLAIHPAEKPVPGAWSVTNSSSSAVRQFRGALEVRGPDGRWRLVLTRLGCGNFEFQDPTLGVGERRWVGEGPEREGRPPLAAGEYRFTVPFQRTADGQRGNVHHEFSVPAQPKVRALLRSVLEDAAVEGCGLVEGATRFVVDRSPLDDLQWLLERRPTEATVAQVVRRTDAHPLLVGLIADDASDVGLQTAVRVGSLLCAHDREACGLVADRLLSELGSNPSERVVEALRGVIEVEELIMRLLDMLAEPNTATDGWLLEKALGLTVGAPVAARQRVLQRLEALIRQHPGARRLAGLQAQLTTAMRDEDGVIWGTEMRGIAGGPLTLESLPQECGALSARLKTILGLPAPALVLGSQTVTWCDAGGDYPPMSMCAASVFGPI